MVINEAQPVLGVDGMPMPPEKRRVVIEALYSGVILPQRRRLQSWRDHTLIATGSPQSTGHIGEMIASLVTGVRGNVRKGKTAAGNQADLTDGTEVKSYNVCDTNIDFHLHGTLHRLPNRTVVLRLTRPEELETLLLRDVRSQVNSVSNNLLQVLTEHDGRWIGSERLYRTKGNALKEINDSGVKIGISKGRLQELCRAQQPALSHTGNKQPLFERLRGAEADGLPDLEGGWYLVMRSETTGDLADHFQYDDALFAGEHFWHLRKERSHINFSNKSRAGVGEILSGGGVATCSFLDPRGRYTVAVFRFVLEPEEITTYLDQVVDWPSQVQPYLHEDNVRTALHPGEGHTLENLGARLLMLGHETADGRFTVVHMQPNRPPTLHESIDDGRSVVDALTGFADPDDCPSLLWESTPLDWVNPDARAMAADHFFQYSMASYYRDMVPFSDLAGSPRNLSFDTLTEHLTSLVSGLRGSRSSAKGVDLYEDDGAPSDVKASVGFKGDNMGTEDSTTRYNLGNNQPKMYGWRRWFPVRIVDELRCCEPTLRAAIFQMTDESLLLYHDQVHQFFEINEKNLQYHTSKSVRDLTCGPSTSRLTFSEMAYFEERREPKQGWKSWFPFRNIFNLLCNQGIPKIEPLNDVQPDHRDAYLQYCQCPEHRE